MTLLSFAFQGAPGAFSHAATIAFAKRLSDDKPLLAPCQTFGDVFSRVTAGDCHYGVIPLENSSIGSIVANYDLLWEHDAAIVAEHSLPVHHQLIGFPNAELQDLKLVYSHPAALDQCRNLFKQHRNLMARVHWDTSGSVLFVKESGDRTCAALAGQLAADEYGMSVIAANVEDYPVNATRFGLITAVQGKLPEPVGASGDQPILKQSFAVELAHEVGSLSKLLALIASAGASLTKIESRPIGQTPWHYHFFMDVEVVGERMQRDLTAALSEASVRYKPLGNYFPSAPVSVAPIRDLN